MAEDKSREKLEEETDDEEVEGDVPETIDDDDLMTVKFLRADRKSTRLNSSHWLQSRMPSSA